METVFLVWITEDDLEGYTYLLGVFKDQDTAISAMEAKVCEDPDYLTGSIEEQILI